MCFAFQFQHKNEPKSEFFVMLNKTKYLYWNRGTYSSIDTTCSPIVCFFHSISDDSINIYCISWLAFGFFCSFYSVPCIFFITSLVWRGPWLGIEPPALDASTIPLGYRGGGILHYESGISNTSWYCCIQEF